MEVLLRDVIKLYLDPPPSRRTLVNLFDRERVPRFKSNPCAKRGGGTVFWSVPHVEKLMRSRLLPGRLNNTE